MPPTKLLPAATDAPLGIGPSDVQPLPPASERAVRIRELFLERHAAALIEAIDAGRLGGEMRKQWRRHKTQAERCWPLAMKRKVKR